MSTLNLVLIAVLLLVVAFGIWYLRRLALMLEFDDDLRFIELNMPYWTVNQKNFRIFKHVFVKCRKHNFNKERLNVAQRQFEQLYWQWIDPTGEFAKAKEVEPVNEN